MLKSYLIGVTVGYFIFAGVYEYSKTIHNPNVIVIHSAEASQDETIPNACELIDVICDHEKKAQNQIKPQGTKENIKQIIREVFKEDAEVAIATFTAESGLRADAVGDRHIEFTNKGITMGHSCGISQIRVLPGRPNCEQLKDARFNIEYAKKLYDTSGFKPWSAYNSGAYLKYMK